MRFHSYLNEKYFNTIKGYGSARVDVFTNPSSKDWKEMKNTESYFGFRFIIDWHKKTIYVWAAMGAIHVDIMPSLKIDPHTFMKGGYKDRYFTGTVDKGIPHIMSDIFEMRTWPNKKEDIQAMLDQDMTWLKRYIDTKQLEIELKSILSDTIRASGYSL